MDSHRYRWLLLGLCLTSIADPRSVAGALSPFVVGRVTLAGGEAVIARDDFVHVSGAHGLQIVGVTDPRNPRLVGRAASGTGTSIAMLGPYVVTGGRHDPGVDYVPAAAIPDASLRVFDLGDPARPTLIGKFPATNAASFFLEGSVAYVADRTNGVVIVDLSNPAQPRELARLPAPLHPSFPIPQTVGVVGVRRNRAYVFVSPVGNGCWLPCRGPIQVYDVSDPARPLLVGQHAEGAGQRIAVNRDIAMLDGDYNRLVDLRDPDRPRSFEVALSPGLARKWTSGFALVGPYVFITDASRYVQNQGYLGGLGLIISEMPRPGSGFSLLVGRLPKENTGDFRDFRAVTADRRFAYALQGGLDSTGSRELLVVDYRSRTSHEHEGYIPFGDSLTAVAVSGSLAALGGNSRLTLARVSAGTPPRVVSSTALGAVNGIVLRGGLAYLAGDGLQVVDVSDPNRPMVLSKTLLKDKATGLAMTGQHAIVSMGQGGSAVYDVSSPRAPRLTSLLAPRQIVWGNWGYPPIHYRSTAHGNLVCILEANRDTLGSVRVAEVGVYELAESGSLRFVSSIPERGAYQCSLALVGRRLYLARTLGTSGVFSVTDLADPKAPKALATATFPGGAGDLAVIGDVAYVAGDDRCPSMDRAICYPSSSGHGVVAWDVSNLSPLRRLPGLPTLGSCLALAADGDLLLAGPGDLRGPEEFGGVAVVRLRTPGASVRFDAPDRPRTDGSCDIWLAGPDGDSVALERAETPEAWKPWTNVVLTGSMQRVRDVPDREGVRRARFYRAVANPGPR